MRWPSARCANDPLTGRLSAYVAIALFIVALLHERVAFALTPPRIEGPVTDTAHVLSAAEKARIETKLRALKTSSGHELAVLVVPTLGGDSVEDFAYTTARVWGLGQKGKDDGVLLLLATGERKLRIETGKGVGGALTDVETNRIIRDRIAPELKKGAYGAGLEAGVDAISAKLLGEPSAPSVAPKETSTLVQIIAILIFLIALALVVLVVGRAQRRSAASTSGGSSYGGYDSTGSSGSDGSSGSSSGGSDFGGGGGDFGGGGSSGDY